ncbi:MAG TPA: DUF58 domain-containing protein [Ohtaekwangia sp.]|nr:DUF58 domain-containing protein [Ohtaekwangia sp.]
MDARIKSLLNPELLSSLNGMELIARIIVEGFMSGSNKSMSIGFGQEFAQYRGYEPGDDLRQLDWKMYARSERYFVKQSEIETNITVKLVLDASKSMAYAESLSKFDYTKILAAAIAYLARKQGDAYGISIVNGNQFTHVHPRFEHQHFIRVLSALVDASVNGVWRNSPELENAIDHHRKEMILLFSDLYDDDGELLRFIRQLKTKRNEVIVFHIMGRNERTLETGGNFTFEDLETGSTRRINVAAVRDTYREKIETWIVATRNSFLERDIHYFLADMSSPVDEVLRSFIQVRKNLM